MDNNSDYYYYQVDDSDDKDSFVWLAHGLTQEEKMQLHGCLASEIGSSGISACAEATIDGGMVQLKRQRITHKWLGGRMVRPLLPKVFTEIADAFAGL